MGANLNPEKILSSFQRLLQIYPISGSDHVLNGTGSFVDLNISGSISASGTVTANSGSFNYLTVNGSQVSSGSVTIVSGGLTIDDLEDREIVFVTGSTLSGSGNFTWDYNTSTGRVTGSWIVSGSSTLESIGTFKSNGTTLLTGSINASGSITLLGGDMTIKGLTVSSSIGVLTAASSSFSSRVTTNETNITNISALSGSYATTGSNNYNGNQVITGSLTVSGSVVNLTAATAISGSTFSGSFVGDGSGLTGIASSSLSNVVFTNLGLGVEQTVQGTLRLTGNIVAENYIISSSVTYMTSSFSSGSTVFGDTLDDTHQFTGSLYVTGSVVDFSSVTSIIGLPSGLVSSSAQISADISGSSTDLSSSLSTRVTTLETNEVYSGSFSGSFQGDGSALTGITVVGGSDTQVQFNDGGSIAGDADFTWNKTSNTLTLPAGTISASFVSASTYYGDGSNLTGLTVETANTASYVEDYNINPNVVTLSISSNVLTWDVSASRNAQVTLDQNITTFNLNGAKAGMSGIILMIQDGTGGRTTVLPGSSKVFNHGGGVVSLSGDANAEDILSWWYNGTSFYWNAGYYYD